MPKHRANQTPRRETRRQEAEVRNAFYQKLSLADKLVRQSTNGKVVRKLTK
jgi:hypothetical protein